MAKARATEDEAVHDEPAHDVLAAEAFAVGEADPGLHGEPAHDVLAAEAFAVPAPAGSEPPGDAAPARRGAPAGALAGALAGLLGLVLVHRHRRRQRSGRA
jgi:hypothetical protein